MECIPLPEAMFMVRLSSIKFLARFKFCFTVRTISFINKGWYTLAHSQKDVLQLVASNTIVDTAGSEMPPIGSEMSFDVMLKIVERGNPLFDKFLLLVLR